MQNICNFGKQKNRYKQAEETTNDTIKYEIFAAYRQRRNRKSQPTKARVWLPFPATVPSQPHTCFFCRPARIN
jgi:hypothetical protein